MDLRQILSQAGFQGSALDTAYAIAMAESGGNAKAFNGNSKTGDKSYGLFQINLIGALGPERRKQYGLSSDDSLYDPVTNARVAFQMSNGGKNWSPWSTYNNDTYRKFLGQSGAPVSGADQAQAALGITADAPPQKADITSTQLGADFAPGASDFRKPPPIPTAQQGVQTRGVTGGNDLRDKLISAAMGVLGTPYSWGGGSKTGASGGFGKGAGITGFDCSGLVMYAFAQAGYSMPRVSYDQLKQGARTSGNSLRPGDLVGFKNGSHIAIYIGDGQIIESPRTGLTVRVRKLGSNENVFGVRLNLPGD